MSGGLSSALAAEVSALALVWRFRRTDGVQFGFTSHDRPLRVGGAIYDCTPGMAASAVQIGRERGLEGVVVRGVFADGLMQRDDLDAGRWADATVDIGLCDWEEPSRGIQELAHGRVAGVRHGGSGGGEFLLELESVERASWNDGPARLSPTCRSRLGDGRCGMSLEVRRVTVLARLSHNSRVMLEQPLEFCSDYDWGRVRVLDGPLGGVEREIVATDPSWVEVDRAFPIGEELVRVRLQQGCNGLFATCRDRFGNSAAFDGEPFLPGGDAMIRYGMP